MTKRQALVKDLMQIMQTIRKENGYKTDCGEVVVHWIPKVIPEQDAELINVKDSESEYTDRFKGNQHNPKLLVIFEVACAMGTVEASYLNLTNQQADINLCIGKNLDFLRGKYGELKIDPVHDDVNIEIYDHVVAEGSVSLTFEYSTNKWLKDEPEYN
ncbi:MAG TPA: hypothetical protein VHO03_03665 [Ignavibacteriales bacterium]|nr:hypothetical protein [Ignavibacteriales bacterium]